MGSIEGYALNSIGIKIIILGEMLNFSITGKKMGVTQRVPDLDPSLMIKSKVYSQKTPSALKNKQPQIQKPKVTAVKQPVPQVKKVEATKAPLIKKQEKVEEKVETNTSTPTMVEQSPLKEPQPVKEDVIGQVIVRYNHYKDPFPTINGVLSYRSIEEKYGFADVFHGDFVPVLRVFKTYEEIEPQTEGKALEYSWRVQQSIEYRLQIQQDEVAQSKRQKKYYKASDNAGLKDCPCNKTKRAVVELTEEMKKLDPSEFGGQKHRQLLQQRDLQDLLFG